MWGVRKHKILIVDGTKHCKKIVKRMAILQGINADYSDVMSMQDKVKEFKPDIILFDTEGFKQYETETIRQKISQNTVPVFALTSSGEGALDAMFAGVHDFIMKPDMQSVDEVDAFISELLTKVKVLGRRKLGFKLPGILNSKVF